ncbi:MAG TPA: enolase C-terminal domain-like protein [Xanthomonadales bacterium]|nr:enolase C-terminal domain-like protein [Xanthomonadales bacterium]
MKICGINTTLLGDAATNQSGSCLVELSTDSGLTGLALAHPWAEKTILGMAKSLLNGEDPRGVFTHWENAEKWIENDADAAGIHARAALDIALWDLKAKAQSEPLWKTLGAGRPRVNGYASWSEAAEEARPFEEWLNQVSGAYGMRAGKLLLNQNSGSLKQRLSDLRNALNANTHEPQLMLDAGRHWLPKEAIRHIRDLESEFDLTWVSGVAEPGDFRGSLAVSNGIRAAVCAGKTFRHISEYLPYLQNYAADVIEINMHYSGITGALQLADAAFGVELPVTLSAYPGNVQVHLASALPYCMSVEASGAFSADSLMHSNVFFESGWGLAGDEPGNGLAADNQSAGQRPHKSVS